MERYVLRTDVVFWLRDMPWGLRRGLFIFYQTFLRNTLSIVISAPTQGAIFHRSKVGAKQDERYRNSYCKTELAPSSTQATYHAVHNTRPGVTICEWNSDIVERNGIPILRPYDGTSAFSIHRSFLDRSARNVLHVVPLKQYCTVPESNPPTHPANSRERRPKANNRCLGLCRFSATVLWSAATTLTGWHTASLSCRQKRGCLGTKHPTYEQNLPTDTSASRNAHPRH
jgi:hypothetical protein